MLAYLFLNLNFNSMFSYRSILSSAWSFAAKRRRLWVFGFLAFLLSAGGEYQIIGELLNRGYSTDVYSRLSSGGTALSPDFWWSLYLALTSDVKTALAVILLILIIGGLLFFVLWLSVRAQIGLVRWTKKDRDSRNKEEVSLWGELTAKDKRFWPVLGVNIFVKIAISAAFTILSVPLIFLYFQDFNWAIVAYTVFFIIFLPVVIVISLLAKYAIAEIILDKETFTKGILDSWKLFKNNWLVSLEMAILLFLINFTLSLILIFLLTMVAFPIMLTLMVFGLSTPLYFFVLISFLLLVLTASFLMTFQTAAWTSLYLELKENGATAKVERVFQNKPKAKKSVKAAAAPKVRTTKKTKTTTAKSPRKKTS